MAKGQIFDLEITGEEALIRNFERMAKNLEAMAPQAIEEAVQPTMAMMKRLVRVDTGKLRDSIRFRIGNQGLAKTGQRNRTSLGKTRVVGYILAGDETTLVGGSAGSKKRKKSGRQWQNARLQEFGTQKMPAKPYFFPSWRATRQKVKHEIGVKLASAFRKLNKPSKAAA